MKTNNANTTASPYLRIVRDDDDSYGKIKRKYKRPTSSLWGIGRLWQELNKKIRIIKAALQSTKTHLTIKNLK